ncbi:luciferin 4-monooxygenase-like [Leguminivora glycinivorella]|uniref:luciferin 4-monooxygenase-like n=1 Tax=Leguminivora glycinivorella TaxID=1035111 RepID=UPI00200DA789|nr:luciferin 4-monooxygenase-like [Leguminivora glycinivorella]
MAGVLIQARSDNHVGHFLVNYMKKDQDQICQIDAATGEQETRRSVLARAIRLAQCFRRLGLKPGDVLVLGGKNHLDVHIPYYAALVNGLPLAGVDPQFKYTEIKELFKIVEPKVAFCQNVMYEDYSRAAKDLGLDIKIFTFDGENSMTKLMNTYTDLEPEEQFKVAEFDVSKVYCWLVSTSGSTGFPKVAALSHSNVLQNVEFFSHAAPPGGERRTAMNLSSIQWISACFNTSAPCTTEHVIDLINKYKPVTTFTTATLLSPILHHEKHCDLTCFDVLKVGGSKIYLEFMNALSARVRKDTKIVVGYGMTECGGSVFKPCPDGPFGNIGVEYPLYQVKIVDPETEKVILEPNVTGELRVKGPRMECYYNNPKATAEAFAEDGYLKSGDLVYKDENGYYFFVDRLKMLLKYKNYQVIPPEIEEVILTHPGVQDVCVTGVPHIDDGERVAACIVRRPGSTVSAQEIKDLVASKMSVHKQLYGGVVFVNELPLTSNGKVSRVKVKNITINSKRE